MDVNLLVNEAEELFPFSQALRRDFHRHPELGYHEIYTAEVISRELRNMGLHPTTGIAETGVVTVIEGRKSSPVILLRFDMDALSVEEETGAEYASENPGCMHACGHDGHMAIGLTIARLLTAHKQELNGSVKIIFQPAEEGLNGAERMVNDGVLENPPVKAALGMHLWNEKPIGWVGVTKGPIMAGSAIFDIMITGHGGHGALPHQTNDPIVTASQVVMGLQTIVSRNIPPVEGAVISVTEFHSGEAFNIIPPCARLGGTIRWYEESVREILMERFTQVTQGICTTMGCTAKIDIKLITPAVVNHPEITELVGKIIHQHFPDREMDSAYRTMGSEDFAFILQKVPGCFLLVGSANHELGLDFGHHHPRFDFDEAILPEASAMLAFLVFQILERLN